MFGQAMSSPEEMLIRNEHYFIIFVVEGVCIRANSLRPIAVLAGDPG